uniref:Helicase ATP-binding domain-containing protein n=1 Tax=viral metagenome TaxID=1070528 RepID=A0A6C0BHH8_9ZZZZ
MSRIRIPDMLKQIPAEKLLGKRILSNRGYSIPKEGLTHGEEAQLKNTLTVTAQVIAGFAPQDSFPVYYESPKRYYLPRCWGQKAFGTPDSDIRKEGEALNESLVFQGSLRPEQLEITANFLEKGKTAGGGIICVPCGWGKTFMSLYIMGKLRRKTIIVVHKEFLVGQWQKELLRVYPKIRIGKLQADKEEVGPEFDITIAMLQTVAKHEYSEGYFNDFGFAIFDECHHLGAAYFSKALMKIQTKWMLGLSATPDRTDGLSKVFGWYLGDLTTKIKNREADAEVEVRVYDYTSTDDAYTKTSYDFKGNPIRARLLNTISEYEPRTMYLLGAVKDAWKEGRKTLILSDRRDHLAMFERLIKESGIQSVAYYVGGMKQVALEKSEEAAILLGTYAMAAEGMNIPALNTIVLSTPKSNIEQSVGRILRQKKDERAYAPRVIDCLDQPHDIFVSQWNKRKDYYKKCAYKVVHWNSKGPIEKHLVEHVNKDAEECLFTDD